MLQHTQCSLTPHTAPSQQGCYQARAKPRSIFSRPRPPPRHGRLLHSTLHSPRHSPRREMPIQLSAVSARCRAQPPATARSIGSTFPSRIAAPRARGGECLISGSAQQLMWLMQVPVATGALWTEWNGKPLNHRTNEPSPAELRADRQGQLPTQPKPFRASSNPPKSTAATQSAKLADGLSFSLPPCGFG